MMPASVPRNITHQMVNLDLDLRYITAESSPQYVKARLDCAADDNAVIIAWDGTLPCRIHVIQERR
jgi:hypothetical protein